MKLTKTEVLNASQSSQRPDTGSVRKTSDENISAATNWFQQVYPKPATSRHTAFKRAAGSKIGSR